MLKHSGISLTVRIGYDYDEIPEIDRDRFNKMYFTGNKIN